MSFRPELDICLPTEQSVCSIYSPPPRWDEFLDLDIPILIHHTCGDWNEVRAALEISGLGSNHNAQLVSSQGEVTDLNDLVSEPQQPWCLVIGWSHPNQGWRSRLPLSGQTFVVTRESSQGQSLVLKLQNLGARAIALPTIRFEPPDDLSCIQSAVEQLTTFQWLIFTSVNGVEHFFNLLQQSQFDHRVLGDCKFACIGPKTAQALEARGFGCDLLPKTYLAEGLLDALQEKFGDHIRGLKILIPRAQIARETLPNKLRDWGVEVVVAPVYKTALAIPDPEIVSALLPETKILFTSASTVKNWVRSTNRTDLECYCIGPITAQQASEYGLNILDVASSNSVDGLLETLLSNNSRPGHPS